MYVDRTAAKHMKAISVDVVVGINSYYLYYCCLADKERGPSLKGPHRAVRPEGRCRYI